MMMMDFENMTIQQIISAAPDMIKKLGESVPMEKRALFNGPAQQMLKLIKLDTSKMTPSEIDKAMSEAMGKLEKIKADALTNSK